MHRLLVSLALVLLALPLRARAAPATLAVQGRLTTAAGGPVADGGYPLGVALYAAKDSAKAAYSELFLSVPVQAGVFATTLGQGKDALDDQLFATGQVGWVGVTVGGEPELERVPLHAVPFALHARTATTAGKLQCSGCVGSGELGDGAVTAGKLADGAVVAAKIATGAVQSAHVQFAWAGAEQKGGSALHALAANTAKIADSAKKADEAASADEAKSAQVAQKLQCTGCVTAAMLADTAMADLVAGKQLAAVAVSGKYADLQGGPDLTPYAKLDAAQAFSKPQTFGAGMLPVAAGEPVPCSNQTTGLVYYDSQTHTLRLCVGGKYKAILVQDDLGGFSNPAKSCLDLLAQNPATKGKDGLYWLEPAFGVKFQAWCDMTTDGGGWTLLEAFDIANKAPYAKAPFATVDLPRSQDSHNWDDYRLAKVRIDPLLAGATRLHARCHRDYAQSPNDFLFADAVLLKNNYGGYNTASAGANPHKLSAKVRGYPHTTYNFLWWNIDGGNQWHSGFDVSGTLPGSTPSEDSFAWHDGGVNPAHLCHVSAGEIVWMVR